SGLAAHGAETVYTVDSDALGSYTTGGFTKGLAAVVAQANPAVVLGAASPVGKDLFPRLGARIGAGVVTEVTELASNGGSVVGTRPVYGGKAFVTATVKSDVALFTVRPNSFPVSAGAGAGAVVAVDAGIGADDVQTKVLDVVANASDVADLTEADRIVAGGRSLKSLEQFDAVIRPLAGSLRATPGASRAAVDAGYAPHSAQVGQTGKVVNPQLYIAAGISGAIQHLAGMRTSKVIVAINKDADAPIFQHSSYGIVDDLFVICPLLQQEFDALLSS
ncbi:MAG: electron transfer flavoprotein subunit alpha/FixB family protein, partial [Deltaproteobacteria bacterium]|nr:electron transfer flavoprotein subunit alpha/FixB family protein [Deltaproteobacteria bacterium]